MSADLLRRAASLMRERAEGAQGGPWSLAAFDMHPVQTRVTIAVIDGSEALVADLAPAGFEDDHPDPAANAEHIASWHPAVALSVADWLDDAATTHDDPYYRENYDDLMRPALAVARAFLGEADDVL